MSEIKIESATYSDEIATVSSLAQDIWHECYREILSTQQIDYMLDKYLIVKEITKQIRQEGYLYYLLKIDENDAGYLCIHVEEKRLFLSKLYILKEYRGKGIPRKVIDFLEEVCEKHLLESVYLAVNKYNTNAFEVYEHLGFAVKDSVVTDIGSGYVMDDYIMERPVHISNDEKYMRKALSLAEKARGNTYPNPMVGAVIVYEDRIIGGGYHHVAGDAHAEVNALNSVKDKQLLSKSTMYVTLEPCSHLGKTPPCTNLIIENKMRRVVIGVKDPFPKVNGQGIKRLTDAGIEVKVGVLENECTELNARFFTFNILKRPYVILKWAQTKDCFIDKNRESIAEKAEKISGEDAQKLLHKWRSEEMAIMVGTRTALLDNPRLDARMAENGKNPLRLVLDLDDKIPQTYHLKDGSIPTLIFTSKEKKNSENVTYINVEKEDYNLIQKVLNELYCRGIQSVIVEGGAKLIDSFYRQNLWDEAKVFVSERNLFQGVKAPKILGHQVEKMSVGEDTLHIFLNEKK